MQLQKLMVQGMVILAKVDYLGSLANLVRESTTSNKASIHRPGDDHMVGVPRLAGGMLGMANCHNPISR